MDNHSSLFAVIPAAVMRDSRLRANAKLLYGEITALARKDGYCWAENSHFAEILGVSVKTAGELISQLQRCGHIQVEVERDPESHVVLARRLWVVGPLGVMTPPPKNRGTSPEKSGDLPRKIGGPPPKNPPALYVDKDNENNTPIAPTGGEGVQHADGPCLPKWRPEEFKDFWDLYRTRCRKENRKGAVKAWDKLKPDTVLLNQIYAALADQVQSPQWQRGIGIPYCSTYLNGRRWEDVEPVPDDDSQEGGEDGWE